MTAKIVLMTSWSVISWLFETPDRPVPPPHPRSSPPPTPPVLSCAGRRRSLPWPQREGWARAGGGRCRQRRGGWGGCGKGPACSAGPAGTGGGRRRWRRLCHAGDDDFGSVGMDHSLSSVASKAIVTSLHACGVVRSWTWGLSFRPRHAGLAVNRTTGKGMRRAGGEGERGGGGVAGKGRRAMHANVGGGQPEAA